MLKLALSLPLSSMPEPLLTPVPKPMPVVLAALDVALGTRLSDSGFISRALGDNGPLLSAAELLESGCRHAEADPAASAIRSAIFTRSRDAANDGRRVEV